MRYLLAVLLFMAMYTVYLKQFTDFTSYQMASLSLEFGIALLLITIVFLMQRSTNE